MAYQRAYFPTNHIYLGQGYGTLSKSHKHSYALDLSGNYTLFAPFDCKVTKVYAPKNTSNAREVWLTSTNKVLCCNGEYCYLTLSITHPADIIKLKVGDTFKQFQSLKISTTKMTGKYDGNHAHIELSKGKKADWDKEKIEKYKQYVNVNAIKPEKYLFITEDTKVLKNTYKLKTYKFIRESDITYKVANVPSEPLYIRNENSRIIGKLYNGDEVLKFDNKARCKVYHYEVLGYTYKKYLKKS